ncbi:MAG: hypothetical protein R2821_13455 [Flavobacteriaceae bacterium]
MLDTHYFRTPLSKDPTGEKRYIGYYIIRNHAWQKEQWKWLENELKNTPA